MGILFLDLIKSLLLFPWDDASVVFKDEVIGSQQDLLSVDGRRNSMGDDIFDLTVQFLVVIESFFLCFRDDRIGNGMRIVFLHACRETECLILAHAFKSDDPGNVRFTIGQSSCLVKDDRIGFRKVFQISSAFDCDPVSSGFLHR